MNVRYLLLVFICLCLWATAAHAGPQDEYDEIKARYKAFDADTKKQKMRHNWLRLIKQFEKLADKYPKHPRGCDSRYNVGMLYERLSGYSYLDEDRKNSAMHMSKLARTCPKSKLADDGYYRSAVMWTKLGNVESARELLKEGIKKTPNGDMTPAMKDLLAGLEPAPEQPASKKKETTKPQSIAQKAEEARPEPPDPKINTLTGVTAFNRKGQTELRVTFSDPPEFTSGEAPATDTKPRRIFFDFPNAKLDPEIPRAVKIDNALVTSVRTAMFNETTVRVVVDFRHPDTSFTLGSSNEPPMLMANFFKAHAQAAKPATVVTVSPEQKPVTNDDDLAGVIGKHEKTATKPDEPKKENSAQKKKPESNLGIEDLLAKKNQPASKPMQSKKTTDIASKKQPTGLKVRKIVVDAGHGGQDYGATGPTGLLEKNVVLSIAKKVKSKLEKRLKVKVVLTRKDDTYLKLSERSTIANKVNADLFISIHANASRNRKITGIETYYLNNSADNYSKRLAARENREIGKPIDDLQFILTDLSMNANISDSIALARFIQNGMIGKLSKKYSKIKDRGVGRALFYVLLNVRMPAVLVETSFISNPNEEKRLKSKTYQDRLADSICDGVQKYINYTNQLAHQ